MNELNLPTLPNNYRWRIKADHSDVDYDAVNIYLEKLHTYMWSGITHWKHVRGGYCRKTLLDESLIGLVEEEARKLYDETFGLKESSDLEGIYYGSDSDWSE